MRSSSTAGKAFFFIEGESPVLVDTMLAAIHRLFKVGWLAADTVRARQRD